MGGYLDLGYTRVRMKMGGGPLAEDLNRIEAVLAIVGGDGNRLCVDANGRFDLPTALEYAQAMAAYGLHWYEEPGDPLDYALNAEVARCYAGPLATGENLLSMQDARNLVRYGGPAPGRDRVEVERRVRPRPAEVVRQLRTR